MTYTNIFEQFEGGSVGTTITTSNTAFLAVGPSSKFATGGVSGQCARANNLGSTSFYDSSFSDSTTTIDATPWTARAKFFLTDTAGASDRGYTMLSVALGQVGLHPSDYSGGTAFYLACNYNFGDHSLNIHDDNGDEADVSVSAHLGTWIDVILVGVSGSYDWFVLDASAAVIASGTRPCTAALYRAFSHANNYRDDSSGEEFKVDDVYFGATASDPLPEPGPPAAATVVGTTQIALAFNDPGEIPTFSPMELVILDPNQRRAPTSVDIILTGAVPGEEITFLLDNPADGKVLWTANADVDGVIYAISIPIPSQTLPYIIGFFGTPVDAGSHTLTARGAKDASDTFTLLFDPSPWPTVQVADINPVAVPGAGNSWVLQDPLPGGLGSWIMSPSPTSMSEPEFSKTVEIDHTTNPLDGKFLAVVASTGVKPWTWSGYCPNKTFYDKLSAFAALNRRIYVIDHRGRAWKTVILDPGLVPRKRQIEDDGTPQDWAHDYTVTAEILDGRWFEPV